MKALAWPASWQRHETEAGRLVVGDGHTIAWWAAGAPDGTPVLVVHGGPGSGSVPATASFFDPTRHRLIFFDQRGCGASGPVGRLEGNRTFELCADMEALRIHLGIRRWLVFGGSWGAALGLVYCQQVPAACIGAVLRGLPRASSAQAEWVLEERAGIWPEHATAFLDALPGNAHPRAAAIHLERLMGTDPVERMASARAVMALEYGLTGPVPESLDTLFERQVTSDDEARARIYLHYWVNDFFLPGGDPVFNAGALTRMPLVFVHGERDWICPVDASRSAVARIPGAALMIVPSGGHSPFQDSMRAAIGQALARFDALS